MSRMFNDPLLGVARAGTLFFMVIVAAVAAIALLAIPLIPFAPDLIPDTVTVELAGKLTSTTLWAIAGLLATVAGMMALIYVFLRHLLRIIDTVAQGDPFIPANAGRLRAMAWLMLAIQLIALPMGALEGLVEQSADGTIDSMTFEFDLNSFVLVLILFILARVFHRGAEMRGDLEGTV